MQKRHIAVWIGLVLAALVWVLLNSLPEIDGIYAGYLDYETQRFLEMVPVLKTLVIVCLLLQLTGVALLHYQPKIALVIAMIGGILLAPLGFIFVAGYLYDYNRLVYNSLKTVPAKAQLPFDVLLKFNKQRQVTLGLGMAGAGIVILLIGVSAPGGMMAGAGIMLFINARRTQYFPALAVSGLNLLFTPGQFAVCYEAPLQAFTVVAETRSLLKLNIRTAEINRTFRIAKADLLQDETNTLDAVLARLKGPSVIQ